MKQVSFDSDKKTLLKELLNQLNSVKDDRLPSLYFDITNFHKTSAKTGIQRLALKWLEFLPEKVRGEYNLVLVVHDSASGYHRYGSRGGSKIIRPKENDIFLSIDLNSFSQVRAERQLMEWQKAGCKLFVCLLDLVFVLFPQTVANLDACSVLTKWLNMILEKYDGIICISKTVMEDAIYYARTNSIENPRLGMSYFHLGTDVKNLHSKTNTAAVTRIKDSGRFNFISVSTVEPRKGYLELVNSFDEALNAGLDANLIIVGRRGWNAQETVERIQKSPAYDKRLFWFSDCDDEEMSQLYGISNCYVSTSYYEGFGLGLMEGASYGLPLLVRNIPVYKELCGDKAVYFSTQDELRDMYKYCVQNREALSKDIVEPLSWKDSVDMGWKSVNSILSGDCYHIDDSNVIPKHINFLTNSIEFQDGICRDIFAQKKALEEMGYRCDIFTSYSDKYVENYRRDMKRMKCTPDDLIIDHVNGYVQYELALSAQTCRKVLLYHNMTPSEFVPDSTREAYEKGLEQIPRIRGVYDFVAADSQYNLDCLKQLGVEKEGDVLPIPVKYSYEKPNRAYSTGKTIRFLSVERIVQHKRIEDVIDAFAYYHEHFNKDSKLTLVGDLNESEDYVSMLKDRISKSGCSDCIQLTGRVSEEELKGLYRESDAYLCMSEYEVFCMSLLEAMYNGLVVFAYDSTAVGETLGDGGVLLKDRTPEKVAGILNEVLSDQTEAGRIIAAASKRVENNSEDAFETRLGQLLEKWTSADYMEHTIDKKKVREYTLERLRDEKAWNMSIYDVALVQAPGFKGKIKKFIKRVARETTKWLYEPLFIKQSEFNKEMMALIESLNEDEKKDR